MPLTFQDRTVFKDMIRELQRPNNDDSENINEAIASVLRTVKKTEVLITLETQAT
jgi:DNA-binding transcriptional regulator WhiA